MERKEIIEWALILLVIVAWWPRIFLDYDPLWYYVLTQYVSPIVLVVILVRRYRRVQEGLEYSRKIVDAQHQATGANVLGRDAETGSVQSPYPGVVIPEEMDAEDGEVAPDDAAQAPPGMPNIPGISGRRPDEDDNTE